MRLSDAITLPKWFNKDENHPWRSMILYNSFYKIEQDGIYDSFHKDGICDNHHLNRTIYTSQKYNNPTGKIYRAMRKIFHEKGNPSKRCCSQQLCQYFNISVPKCENYVRNLFCSRCSKNFLYSGCSLYQYINDNFKPDNLTQCSGVKHCVPTDSIYFRCDDYEPTSVVGKRYYCPRHTCKCVKKLEESHQSFIVFLLHLKRLAPQYVNRGSKYLFTKDFLKKLRLKTMMVHFGEHWIYPEDFHTAVYISIQTGRTGKFPYLECIWDIFEWLHELKLAKIIE